MTFRAFSRIGFTWIASALSIGTAVAAPLTSSVESALQKSEEALTAGRFQEAEAYAELAAPSRVDIELDLAGAAPHAREAVESAMKEWESALQGQTELRLVEKGKGQVRIKFLPTVYFAGQACAGRATWSRQVHNWGGYFSASVSGTIELPAGADLRSMKATAMHEIGHILGLADGSEGVMAPAVGRPLMAPLACDVDPLLRAGSQVVALRAYLGRLRSVDSSSL